jgi:D-alanyl-D-alanine carboxypeptidase
MLKKIKLKRISLIICCFVVAIVSITAVLFFTKMNSESEYVFKYMKQHPENVALTVIRNNNVIASFNSNRMMPLASVVKIIIAIEYAQQSANGKINPDEPVSLTEIDKYYIPKLDGDAQPNWIDSLKSLNLIKDNSVSLKEVAKGMIDFSSDANMEYLIEILGIDNINKNISTLGLKNHDKIYPIYSYLLAPYELMKKNDNLPEKERIAKAKEELRNMTKEQFYLLAMQEHNKLANDIDGAYKKEVDIEKWYDNEFDKIFSDRMVPSTTEDYGLLLSKINDRNYFSPQVQNYLDQVMEGPMESAGNQELFQHLGMKGGSTNYILNTALYAIDKKDDSTEIVLFINNIEQKDYKELQGNMNKFLEGILTKSETHNKLVEEIGAMK